MSDMKQAFINNDNLIGIVGLGSIAANSKGYTNTASVYLTLVLSGTSSVVSGPGLGR